MKSAALEAIYELLLEHERARGQFVWPSARYRHDVVGFCRDILGFALTSFQRRIVEAATTHTRTAVRSARKLGKSRAQAALALHHFCSYEDATAILVAPTEAQIERVVYFDMLQLMAGSGRCLSCKLRDPDGPRPCPHSACVDGDPSPSCRSGVRVGARRIFGVAPRNADHMRGISGARQRYLCDESPGIDEEVFHAAEGNVASGGSIVACGNPSSRIGWFANAHNAAGPWARVAGSALESPNVVLGRRVVDGLADVDWIATMDAQLEKDDPRYQVDVLGEFPSRAQDRIVDDVSLAKAFERFEATSDDGRGELCIGIDPAGGDGGDKSTIAVRRGLRVLALVGFMGATDRIMAELDVLFHAHRKPGEPVQINFDAAGQFGADLATALGGLRKRDQSIHCTGLDGRGDTNQQPLLKGCGYARPRDAYWANMARLVKTALAIPFDEDLREDLLFGEWLTDHRGRGRLPEKTLWRKSLGKSPDLADALAYALWEGRVAPLSDFTDRIAAQRAAERAAEAAKPPRASLPVVGPYPRDRGVDSGGQRYRGEQYGVGRPRRGP